MNNNRDSNQEKEYLQDYDINKYERPSLATDIVIFSIQNDLESENIRKLQKQSLKLLLIKRGSFPFENYWALPGGFCVKGEDVVDTAKRELLEETNVSNAYLQLIGAFGEDNRDPRGWVVSNSFMALVDGQSCELKASTDASEARWFGIELCKDEMKRTGKEDSIYLETDYRIVFTNNENQKEMEIKLREYKTFQNYHETIRYEIVENSLLAFDHAKIILTAVLTLRKEVETNMKLVFDLLPEVFYIVTVTECS